MSYKFTNKDSPYLDTIIDMFYSAASRGVIGIMEAKRSDTGEEELLLVGVEVEGDSIDCYPLASIIKAEQASVYMYPDGVGGWGSPLEETADG